MRQANFSSRALAAGLLLLAAFGLLWAQDPTLVPKKDPTYPFITEPASSREVALTKPVKEELLAELSGILMKEAFVPGVDLKLWPDFIAKQQEAIDKAVSDSDFADAVNSALGGFGVSHIQFMPPRLEQNRVRTTTVGIGISAHGNIRGLVISSVYPSSPAETAGLHEGDTILTVDGKAPDSGNVLEGETDTTVLLHVRAKAGAERDVKVMRTRYSTVRAPVLTWRGEDTAVLKFYSFTRGYDRTAVEKLMQEAAKAKRLILDLRSNGGGSTTNLRHLLSLLLPDQTVIGTFISREDYDRFLAANPGSTESDPVLIAKGVSNRYTTQKLSLEPFKGKIAVLINRGTASASEICAKALSENLGSPIVGTESEGAALASVYRRLPHGYEIQFPVMDYVSKDGFRIERNPIVPDIEVSEQPSDGKDPVLDAAIDRLQQAE